MSAVPKTGWYQDKTFSRVLLDWAKLAAHPSGQTWLLLRHWSKWEHGKLDTILTSPYFPKRVLVHGIVGTKYLDFQEWLADFLASQSDTETSQANNEAHLAALWRLRSYIVQILANEITVQDALEAETLARKLEQAA